MSNQANKQSLDMSLPVKLVIIVAAVVLMLAVVNGLTSEKIAANEAEKSNAARQAIFTDAVGFKLIDFNLTKEEEKSVSEIYAAESVGEDFLGYCISVVGSGFGGDISLIVGVDFDGSIVGVQVVSHSETPGIGSVALAEDGALLPAFVGAKLSDVDGVSAVSGATYSSAGVKEGVSIALEVAARILKEGY